MNSRNTSAAVNFYRGSAFDFHYFDTIPIKAAAGPRSDTARDGVAGNSHGPFAKWEKSGPGHGGIQQNAVAFMNRVAQRDGGLARNPYYITERHEQSVARFVVDFHIFGGFGFPGAAMAGVDLRFFPRDPTFGFGVGDPWKGTK